MKTTIELPADLLSEAKAAAARRRITLTELLTHALRREIGSASDPSPHDVGRFEVGPFGILRLRPRGKPVTGAMVRRLLDTDDDRAFRRGVKASG